jgi:hypothetical protein
MESVNPPQEEAYRLDVMPGQHRADAIESHAEGRRSSIGPLYV